MIQGYDEGNKEESAESVSIKCEEQDPSPVTPQPTLQHVSPALSSAPPAKRPRTTSPSRVSRDGGLCFTTPRTLHNNANLFQVRSVIPITKALSLPKTTTAGPTCVSTIRQVSASSLQGVVATLGSQTHTTPSSVTSTIVCSQSMPPPPPPPPVQLSEGQIFKTPNPVSSSPVTKPCATPTLVQRLTDGSKVARSQPSAKPPTKLNYFPISSGTIASVHSYSLASASVVTSIAASVKTEKEQTGQLSTVLIVSSTEDKKTVQSLPAVRKSSVNTSSLISDILTKLKRCNKIIFSHPKTLNNASSSNKLTEIIPSTSKPKITNSVVSPANHKELLQKLRNVMEEKMDMFRVRYYTELIEYYFLKNGGNYIDFPAWRKKPNPSLIEFMKPKLLYGGGEKELKRMLEVLTSGPVFYYPSGHNEVAAAGSANENTSTSSSSTVSRSPSRPETSRVYSFSNSSPSTKVTTAVTVSSPTTTVTKSIRQPIVTPKAAVKHNSLSDVYDSSIGSQEEIVERAKQEAYVMQRIGDLRKEGLWSLKRLPKVQEPPRAKVHWDYLLEEMVWLAADFAQERKWKKAAAKKCARMITKYFQDKDLRAEKAEKEYHLRLRRIASTIAKDVRAFWANIEKLVEYKQQAWLDAKKKKALDTHLNYIVDQTEKYSSWLTQGLNRNVLDRSGKSSPDMGQKKFLSNCDDDFQADESESDDEETIIKAESRGNKRSEADELKLLVEEGDKPIEELLGNLTKDVLQEPAPLLTSSESSAEDDSEDEDSKESANVSDEEFQLASDVSEDNEDTFLEQEEKEKGADYSGELKDLQDEGELPIEQLYEKYKDAYTSDFDMDVSDSNSCSELNVTSDNETEISSLMDLTDSPGSKKSVKSEDNPSKEITDIAATAERFQPKGNTLSTTQVCTKVPFVLKHQLREYQHIGLDWLNAMFEKKLNGILADEMGLGKTIQTISVLAHLACEKGIWGPHLIVVPTSVMLNWEMELKKWAPAFKILTYYGTPKERKNKRIGWTKQNAFHVCITSYKLVVQDHQSFRRKRWVYLILDEAQHIKNFKSQRWQMLLNFQSTHRLLLTGTPLQNNLMELWSLMHFLMPNVFQSHRDFREWFVNPVTGMIEGNHEYNENLIKRLHKVLRPFLLRRLKSEVEKQLPKKYEHVVMCRLSKRQRYLYDDFMSQTKTKETLATGNFMSVINILMQLRKVCNHPNMFDPRPIVSPFMMSGLNYNTASLACSALDYDPMKNVSLNSINLHLADIELCVTAFAAHRTKRFQKSAKLIEEIDSAPNPPPPVPRGKIRMTITGSQVPPSHIAQTRAVLPQMSSVQSRHIGPFNAGISSHAQRYTAIAGQGSRGTCPVAAVQSQVRSQAPSTEYTLQLLQQPSTGLPVSQLGGPPTSQVVASAPFTVQIPAGARMPLSIGRLVQTSTGQHILLTPSVTSIASESQPVSTVAYSSIVSQSPVVSLPVTTSIATAAVLSQAQKVPPTAVVPPIITALNRSQNISPIIASFPSSTVYNKQIGRLTPLHSTIATTTSAGLVNQTSTAKAVVVQPMSKIQQKPRLEVPPISRVREKKSIFYLDAVATRQAEARRNKLRLLGAINNFRCAACPVYGKDLIEAVVMTGSVKHSRKGDLWKGRGYVNCLNSTNIYSNVRAFMYYTQTLTDIIQTPESCLAKLKDVIDRFIFVVPAVVAPPIRMHVSHPPPSKVTAERNRVEFLASSLSTPCALLHPIISNTTTQFPELRLIEYDCGKLQRLAHLLYQLKVGQHRVLIFTQMTRMLDILEQFLSYHGHTYLRLDGNTKIEQRQCLMERFNNDNRVFCFILSTRSGGIGVNLTGADTVIFYDSDWNPTMDAQAQDRCHRIGQTRDVHIYRLISERTIEENILKKANQKRILGDLAIEGGNFTTAFFKTNSIHDLFGIDVAGDIKPESIKRTDLVEQTSESASESPEIYSQVQLEQALGMAEEENDIQAAKVARDEAAAEFAEFDESIPFDVDGKDNEVEEEFDRLMGQLTPIERYAVKFYESLQDPASLEQLEEEIEAQKRDWELDRLKALKEEQERRLSAEGFDPDDPLICMSRDTVSNQVFISVNGQEEMPIWAPPTPPQDDNDFYIDYNTLMMYEQTPMPESQLPAIYVKKENKRLKIGHIIQGNFANPVARKQKVRKDDISIPRSLFDRPTASVLKMRREAKLQRIKGFNSGGNCINSFKPLSSYNGSKAQSNVVMKSTEKLEEFPDWMVYEDLALLQVMHHVQGLHLSVPIVQPAHIPNWDLCADAVNLTSPIYRSPRQCKARYENFLIAREEGRASPGNNPKNQKKTKGIYKTKNNRNPRTNQLYQQDSNATFTKLCHEKFCTILSATKNRGPAAMKQAFHQTVKSPRGALVETGIQYDNPLTPSEVASIRADRIAKEKAKNQAAAQSANQAIAATPEQQLAARQQAQQNAAAVTNIMQQQTQAVIANIAQAQQMQAAQAQLNKAGLQCGTVTTVSMAKSLTSGLLVNTASGTSPATFATLTKALGQAGVTSATVQGSAVQNATIAALASSNLRANPRVNVTTAATTLMVQEMVAVATGGQVRGLTTANVTNSASATSPAVVSVAGLTAVQLQAASQRLAAPGLTTTTTPSTGTLSQISPQVAQKNITHLAQIQSLRQSAAVLRQREQQTLHNKQQQTLKRFQAAQQQQALQQAKVTAGGSGTANLSVVTAAQQKLTQQQQALKQVGRTMTEAEMTQYMKRQQLQHKQAQITTSQILAQAQQLQQQQQQQQLQQLQQQPAVTSTLQAQVATLVKTVSAPSLTGSSSVAIPVSAVSAAGVNISVSLPQGKIVAGQAKGTPTTLTNQQYLQYQLQQQLRAAAQRKTTKVTNLSQLAKVQGKTASALSSQLNAVQIIPGSAGACTSQAKSLQTTMTVQQIQQAMKQVLPQSLPVQVSATQGANTVGTLGQNPVLSHHTVLPTAASLKSGHPSSIATAVSNIQTLTAASVATPRIIPVAQTTSNTAPSGSVKQAIQVVSATPSLNASLQSSAIRAEMTVTKAQMTTLPSGTLMTSSLLKGSPTVVVGQQQTAAILQQVASSTSSSNLSHQQAVTLAVRAAASQAVHGQSQVQIQVQQAGQGRIQQVSLGQGTINIPTAQISSNISNESNLQQSPTHVLMQNVTVANQPSPSTITIPATLASSPSSVQLVQSALQAARQQQQQQQQQNKASPFTMQLRNPPK